MSQETGGPSQGAPDAEGIFVLKGDKHYCLIPLYKRNPGFATVIGVGDSKESAMINARDLKKRLGAFFERIGQDPRI